MTELQNIGIDQVAESETMIERNNCTVQPIATNNNNGSVSNQNHRPKKVRLFNKIVNFCGQDDLDKKKDKRDVMYALFCLLGLLFSTSMMYLFWCTNLYNEMLLARLALLENSVAAEWWARPPFHSYLNVHIFNYTNVEEYQAGIAEKLVLEDLGPYVYEEYVERVNVVFNENKTISYQERKSYKFVPELTRGTKFDKVIVPNVPMISAMAMLEDAGFIMNIAISQALSITESHLFKTLPAHSFLWGYEDGLVEMSKSFKPLPFEKFGILVNRNGTSKDIFTIHNGEGDFDQVGVITGFNGETKMDYWSSEYCNTVEGTDGSQFAPTKIQNRDAVQVYIKDICRKFVLEYYKDVSVLDNIPAVRYRAPEDIFAHPDNKPENQCYCTNNTACPPAGVFNSTICTFGAPIMVSFPHFYTGDKDLIAKYVGINPDEEKHATYADIHPRMGFPISYASRFQINVNLPQSSLPEELGRLEKGDLLPVIWLEVKPGPFPEEIQNVIYHSSFSANAAEAALRYGSLLLSILLLILFIYLILRIKNKTQ